MTEWKARRFWTTATVEPAEQGFTVLLDGRPVRTPAKTRLLLPTKAAAEAVAAEWQAQDKIVDPRTMPVTRAANAALDKVTPQRDEVIGLLAAYGETDLVCYTAPNPRPTWFRDRPPPGIRCSTGPPTALAGGSCRCRASSPPASRPGRSPRCARPLMP
ncbi:MAG: ATP12 family protein [Paracoccaceae bacterium]